MPSAIFNPSTLRIIDLLEQGGARDVLAVGGAVRDFLLRDPEIRDVDLEVYGLSYSRIAEILRPYYRVDLVGQAFGVLKVSRRDPSLPTGRFEIDVALPRRESKNGIGHKGFDVDAEPLLGYEEAFARRDFTINAIGMRRDGTLIDPYHGKKDLEKKILRAPTEHFKDDPLRVLRGMQFAARFGFTVDEVTLGYCREVFPEFPTLSKERIYDEWRKWALRGKYPSLGLDVLKRSGWVAAFPELNALIGTPQDPKWHPEGDVWTHTALVCDEAQLAIQQAKDAGEPFSELERTVLMFAALAHDFGKPTVTLRDQTGTIRSHGHAEQGVAPTRTFLETMRAPVGVVDMVLPLVREHMVIVHHMLDSPTPRAVRRLACKLEPASLRLWVTLCQSDALGCFPPATEQRTIRFHAEDWLNAAKEESVADEKPAELVRGRDLIPLGVRPGPEMGRLLHLAYEAQIEGEFVSTQEGLAWLRTRGFVK
ncbi:MAG: CCA tRNA nucleotidyltransferase [Thermoguttaceae bacterium]|jgi:tRNA nucleotidyltransferase (CCA-adding enzyme)